MQVQACKVPQGWSLAHQFQKILEEVGETGEELKKYYNCRVAMQENNLSPEDAVKNIQAAGKAIHNTAIEAGDIAQSAFTLIDLMGYDIEEIMEEVRHKNAMRGYYE